MPKRKAVTESELKAALSAIRDRKVPDISEVGISERARIQSLRSNLIKRLQPVFAEAGFDVEKINKILADHQSEVRSVLEKEKSKSAKTFAALNKDLQKGIENRKKALEQLASRPAWMITLVPLLTAWLVDATPLALVDKHIEASNNWVRILYKRDSDGHDNVYGSFWFYWQNLTGDLAIMYSADADLVVQGYYEATGNGDPFWGGETIINLDAQLFPYQQSAPVQLPDGGVPLGSAHANGPDIWHAGRPGIDPEYISGTYHLSFPSDVFVPAGDYVMFQIRFHAEYWIRNGTIYLDFDKDQSKFIRCPGMQLSLLTMPPVVAA